MQLSFQWLARLALRGTPPPVCRPSGTERWNVFCDPFAGKKQMKDKEVNLSNCSLRLGEMCQSGAQQIVNNLNNSCWGPKHYTSFPQAQGDFECVLFERWLLPMPHSKQRGFSKADFDIWKADYPIQRKSQIPLAFCGQSLRGYPK